MILTYEYMPAREIRAVKIAYRPSTTEQLRREGELVAWLVDGIWYGPEVTPAFAAECECAEFFGPCY